MRALLVDDERLARSELRRLLEAHPQIEVVGEARDADEGRRLVEELNPDLLFLDVQMPGKTGFDLLTELGEVPRVIFTTAYDEYALKAFEVSALDYLVKPIAPARLEAALRKLPAVAKPRKAMEQVFVKDGDRCWFVRVAEIVALESEGNYTRLYFLRDGGRQRPLVNRSLVALEERLDPAEFFRASRSHVVNLRWVKNVDTAVNGNLELTMEGGLQVELSRRQSQKFKDTMSL